MNSAALTDMLDSVLGKLVTEHHALRPNTWEFRIPDTRRNVRAELSEDWLQFSVRPGNGIRPPNTKLVSRMLRRNAKLVGRPRIILNAAQHQTVTEIPTDLIATDNTQALQALISSVLGELSDSLRRRTRDINSDTDVHTHEHKRVPQDVLVQMLGDAKWPANSDGNELKVPLAISGEFLTARILHSANGLILQVALAAQEFKSAPAICRDAVSVLLWLTAARFRLVKPTLNDASPALEVFVPQSQIDASALGHACAALSATAQAMTDETSMLIGDERLAQIYLTNLGFEVAA